MKEYLLVGRMEEYQGGRKNGHGQLSQKYIKICIKRITSRIPPFGWNPILGLGRTRLSRKDRDHWKIPFSFSLRCEHPPKIDQIYQERSTTMRTQKISTSLVRQEGINNCRTKSRSWSGISKNGPYLCKQDK